MPGFPLRVVVTIILLIPGTMITAEPARLPARPNVILILTDDQGWYDLGAHGNEIIQTPVMDRLSREGVSFSRFYASPVCTPTRASLMTGRYYPRTGAVDTFMGRDVMHADEVTLGQVFQDQGYRTALIGKWHLGRYMKYHPNQRGFDDFFGFWQYGFINRYFDPDELWWNNHPVETTGYVTDVLTDQAIGFIERNQQQPFFLYLAYNAPHFPHLAPDPLIQKYLEKGLNMRDARIYAMIDSIDQNVGRLLGRLDELQLNEKTLVIFMSDNGGVSQHYKAGLRGLKASVYEGGIRVPFIARMPGTLPAGKRVDVPAQHIDLFPTLCEWLAAPLPEGRPIDGRSILPWILHDNDQPVHDYLYHQWCRVRPDPNKNWAVQDGRYKLANGELYDLKNDLGETTDIAAEHPEKVQELRTAFLTWFEDVTGDLADEPVPIQVGRADENPVELDVTWAKPIGKAITPRYHNYNRDRIANWTEPDEYVRWKIDVVRPGSYEVIFEYGCAPDQAGSSFRIIAGDAQLDGEVQPSGGRELYASFPIGRLEIASDVTHLEIHPIRIQGEQLMSLHKVWLRRVE